MYVLYDNSEVVDRFNPILDYREGIDEEEAASWQRNAQTVARFVPHITKTNIENYLKRWDLEEE
jgi:hypothetical protein